MTITKLFALATTAALLPAAAFAQSAPTTGCCAKDATGAMACCDKDADGTMGCCAKMKADAPVAGDAPDHSTMDHSTMDHSTMNHGAMAQPMKDHGSMDHSTMNHGAMNHGAMASPPAKPAPEPAPVSPSSADRPITAR